MSSGSIWGGVWRDDPRELLRRVVAWCGIVLVLSGTACLLWLMGHMTRALLALV